MPVSYAGYKQKKDPRDETAVGDGTWETELVLLRITAMYVIPLVFCGLYPYIVFNLVLDKESSAALAAFWIGTLLFIACAGTILYLMAYQTNSVVSGTNMFPMRTYVKVIAVMIIATAILTGTRTDGRGC